MFEIKGMLSLYAGKKALGGADRIELLELIAQTGSITAAAKAAGMSYKGAWDAIQAMNNLSDEPLVLRTTGGTGGGGSALSPRALRLIDVFRALDREHRRFVRQLDKLGNASMDDIQLLRRFMIKTSARNQISCKVVKVHKGAVNDSIELQVQGGQRLFATVTCESTRHLELKPGKEVMALVKASLVVVALPDPNMRLSACNLLAGRVGRLTPGAVNAEVTIDLDGGGTMTAIITLASARSLRLKKGVEVLAVVNASMIILGTMD
jgi:molybdate transport system regulatory protein